MSEPIEVLIITGTCGVGKTSLAKSWAKSKNGAIVESDYFTKWIFNENFPRGTEEEKIFTSELSVLVAFEYLKKGMSVAVENVWFPKEIEEIRKELFRMQNLVVKTVKLNCDLEKNLERDLERVPDNQMKERVKVVKDELDSAAWPSYVHQIDTTNMTVEAIREKIELLG